MKITRSRFLAFRATKSPITRIMQIVKFLALLVCLACSHAAFAVSRTWDGSSSGNWATGANWSGGTAPAAGDDLVFPAGVAQLLTTNNFSPNRAFNSITFLGSNYVVHGSALILTNGIRVGTPGGNNSTHTFDTIAADLQINASQSFFVTNTFTELVVQGDIALGANTLTLDGSGTTTIFGAISGTGGAITKDGFGIVNFETNNSFTGGCIIFDGRIRAKERLSLGATAGGTIVHSGGMLELQAQFTNEVLTLSGGTLFVNISPGRWVGTINVVSNSSILAAGDFFIDGPLLGTGNLSVDAAISGLRADVNLIGSQNNTYSGTLQLLDGVLVLGKAAGFTALSGPLIVGTGGAFNATNAVALYAGNNQISSGNVTVNQDGTLDLNGNSDLIGSLTMIGGVVTNTGSGFLQLGGNVNVTSVSGGPARIRSQFNLGTAARTFFVTNGPSLSDLEIDRRVFGTFNLNKDGAGVMSLLASNSMSGIVHVLAGTLQVDDDFAFGTLGGDRVVVHDGATLNLLTGADNLAQNLALNGEGDGGSGALRSIGTVSWNGSVTLVTDCLINVASGTLTIAGVMDGSGGFAKIGPGTLRLTGASGNTYDGNTELRVGILELAKSSSFAISNSASLLVGDASDGESTDTVRYADDNQLRTTVNIFIHRTGLLNLNGFTDDVGDIDLTGGEIQTGAGTLQLRGNLTAIGDLTPGSPFSTFDGCTISGNLDLGTSTRTFTVNDNGFLSGVPVDLIVDAVISGTGAITKAGAGELQLGGTNTYSGTTTINAGRIVVVNNGALGGSVGGTVANSPGIVELRDDTSVANEPVTLNNSSTNPAVLFSSSGTNAWNGPISLTRTAAVNVATSSSLNLGGVISGVGGVTKIGNGILSFLGGGNNTYAGTTLVLDGLARVTRDFNEAGIFEVIPGRLIVGDNASAPSNAIVRFEGCCAIDGSSQVSILASGLIDVNGTGNSFGSLSGPGPLQLGTSAHGSTAAGLSVGANNLTTTFDGLVSGSIGSLTKVGAGTLTLTANSTYTAPTVASAGTLIVNGNQTGSDLTVRSNATLAGTGSGGDLMVARAGNVSPGLSPGVFDSQTSWLSNASVLQIEITGPTAGTDYDQLNVSGGVNILAAQLAATLDPSFAPFDKEVFTLINNNGSDAINGTFTNILEGTILTLSGIPFRASYVGGSGNDFTLSVTNLPLRAGAASVSTGNGDGRVDPIECNTLFLRVTNVSAATFSNITGTLETTMPGVVITERSSPYASLPPGSNGTNLVPFQFFTTSNFLCGQSIEFLLTINASNQPLFALRHVLQSGVTNPAVTFSNNTLTAIPAVGIINVPIVVSNFTGNLAKVTASTVLSHSSVSELILWVIPPGGPAVALCAGQPGTALGTNCNTSPGRTIFDDDATLPITAGTSPYVATFQPVSPLSSLDGRAAAAVNGTWMLQIQDFVSNASAGTLSCWSLTFTPASCASSGGICDICNGPFTDSITTNDTQVNTIIAGPPKTTCAPFIPCSFITASALAPTDVYRFTNGNATACVTVSLDVPCAAPTNALISAAVLNGPSVTNCVQLLGFSDKITNSPASYSFVVPSNAVFTVTVSGGTGISFGLCSNYTLRVEGFDCALSLGARLVSSNRLRINWPTYGSNFRLECATNVPSTDFVTVTNQPVVEGGDFVITNDVTAGRNQFYRLRKP